MTTDNNETQPAEAAAPVKPKKPRQTRARLLDNGLPEVFPAPWFKLGLARPRFEKPATPETGEGQQG